MKLKYSTKSIFWKIVLAIYICILSISVFAPRRTAIAVDAYRFRHLVLDPVKTHGMLLARTAEHLLYVGGFWSWAGNVVIIIPLYFLLKANFPELSSSNLFLIGIGTSIFIEFIQIYVPGRVSDVRDIISNTCGLIIAQGFYQMFAKLKLRNLLKFR